MLIAQAGPVLTLAVSATVLALVVGHIWAFLNLNRSRRLLIRILDMTSDLSIAVSRLEQIQQTGNASSAELRKMAAKISKTITRPGLDIDNLLSDMRPAGGQNVEV
jgi:hypothetical protein